VEEQGSIPVEVEPSPVRKKVAIVGSASSTRDKAPFDDEEFEIWGLAWRDYKRCTRFFDIHGVGPHRKRVQPEYEKRLAALGAPVYLRESVPGVPNGVTYPIDSIISFLNSFDKHADGDYFASSVAYMIALAMYEGFEEIQIYGIDLLTDDEYSHQRPNAEYFIGLARGKGISVYVPPESALLTFGFRYGYETQAHWGPISYDLIDDHYNRYSKEHEAALGKLYFTDGAMDHCKLVKDMIKHYDRGQYGGAGAKNVDIEEDKI
jgi:hypothetical protein